jgi:hypothetical protein
MLQEKVINNSIRKLRMRVKTKKKDLIKSSSPKHQKIIFLSSPRSSEEGCNSLRSAQSYWRSAQSYWPSGPDGTDERGCGEWGGNKQARVGT